MAALSAGGITVALRYILTPFWLAAEPATADHCAALAPVVSRSCNTEPGHNLGDLPCQIWNGCCLGTATRWVADSVARWGRDRRGRAAGR